MVRDACDDEGEALAVRVETVGPAVVVTAQGEIDMATGGCFAAALAGALDAPGPVVVDLAGVRFMDSTGLHALLGLLAPLRRAGRRLAVACPPGPVREVLRAARLERVVGVRDDRAGALAAALDGAERS